MSVLYLAFLGLVVINGFVLPEYRTYKELSSIPSIGKWPTYTDSRLGLSFQYPPSWKVRQYQDGDYYQLFIQEIGNPGNGIHIDYSNNKIFKEIQIDPIIKDYSYNVEKVNINGLNFIQVKYKSTNGPYFYLYLEGKIPIRFQLSNYYSMDEPSFHPYGVKKMDEILNKIIHTMKYVK